MSCINFNKPTHSQLKTRPSNQSFWTCKTISFHQALLHKTTLLLHRSRSPTRPPLSRRAARGNGWLGDNKRQADLHRIHKTACTDICTTPEACCLQRSNNPAENDAGRQTGSGQWPRGQHEPCHLYLASSASWQSSGLLQARPTSGSATRPIKPDLVFPGGQSQNISVSGLAIDDVNHWPTSPGTEVRRAVIHIGVNTCKLACGGSSLES